MLWNLWRKFAPPFGFFVSWVSGALGHTHLIQTSDSTPWHSAPGTYSRSRISRIHRVQSVWMVFIGQNTSFSGVPLLLLSVFIVLNLHFMSAKDAILENTLLEKAAHRQMSGYCLVWVWLICLSFCCSKYAVFRYNAVPVRSTAGDEYSQSQNHLFQRLKSTCLSWLAYQLAWPLFLSPSLFHENDTSQKCSFFIGTD